LENNGIKTHYRGLGEGDEPVRVDDLASPTDTMSISLAYKPEVRHRKGSYHYEDLAGRKNFLIPLEIVFRNYVPGGSSLRERCLPEEVGIDGREWPEGEVELESPVVEFSTKLERQDRYLDEERAFEISGLNREEFGELKRIAAEVNRLLTERAKERGFKHLDGKIECIYDSGEILVADVAGTFDENRFSYAGRSVSKEVLRSWYKNEDREWYEELVDAKEKARGGQVEEWRDLVDSEPRQLPEELLRLVSNLYRAGANQWLKCKVFAAPEIPQIMEGLEQWKKKNNS
ncbi:phosphoribosylaminoimidazolesuccinocarboxamide synthase, partial [Candidatus Bipolaricaulota bacterium]|nr:phosphoribosylaminoimidazolesuccinocarboxamide synthase [Candidatus Bipolaricaulota bacterium]